MTAKGYIESKLRSLPIGATERIQGRVVTRWSHGNFEIGTWGQEDHLIFLSEAVAILYASVVERC